MNGSLLGIVGASQLVGLTGVGLAALATHRLSPAMIHRLVAFAAGTLLATALLDILPEALAHAPAEGILQTILISLLALFALEKAALWRHSHQPVSSGTRSHRIGVIVVGDGLHNFTDGVLIAASFAADPTLGWITTLAIIAHEVPQEIGDFLIMRDAGLTTRQALLLNLLSSLMAVVGGIAGYWLLEKMHHLLPYVLACSATSFLYIAIADLLPAMNRHWSARETRWQVMLLGGGIAVIPLLHHASH